MTEQKAIEIVKEVKWHADGQFFLDVVNAREMAIEALEKQIPKKPTYGGDGYAPDGTFVWDEWICPNCNERYELEYDEYDYCPSCGQRIDWSKEGCQ